MKERPDSTVCVTTTSLSSINLVRHDILHSYQYEFVVGIYASRDAKWTGKCKAECFRLRPNQKPTPGLWTAADFAVTLTTSVGKIAFARREAVHSTIDHLPTSKI